MARPDSQRMNDRGEHGGSSRAFFRPSKEAAQTPPAHRSAAASYNAKSLSLCSTPAARALLDYDSALALNVLPLGLIELEGRTIFTAAAAEATDMEKLAALKFAVGLEVRLLPAPGDTLKDAIFKAYHGDEQRLAQFVGKAQAAAAAEPQAAAPAFHPPSGEAASFLAALIEFAVSQQASDIHLIPMANGSIIRLRIDGRLCENASAVNSRRFHEQLITRLKVLANLSVTRALTPLDGRFEVPTPLRSTPVRLSVMPTVHGEKAVLRLLGRAPLLSIEQLGINARARSFLDTAADRRRGAILFSGPTGSGKTSSMYALLRMLRDRNQNVISIEDPVEIELEGVSQTSIDERQGLSYEACLRSVLRQDPDVIMLGEIRDAASAEIALHAALSGHLVLSTVHAHSVFEVMLRLGRFRLDPPLLAQALALLVSQRLIPRLCQHCKVVDLAAAHAVSSGVCQPVGCSACDYSGFEGRSLAVEAFAFEADTAQALAAGRLDPNDLPRAANPRNYLPLEDDLQRLLKDGQISWRDFLLCGNGEGHAGRAGPQFEKG